MRRDNVNDFLAFIAVARERSFTKAAAKLGVSQSALSYTVRTLEARLGLRLLTRTTRSVSLTEAGERLLGRIGPRFDEIESEISALSALRDKPAGTVRITSVEHAAETILWPAMARLLPEYPDVNVEIISDYSLTDIVADRYDAGVRLGEQVDKDMIAVPIGPDFVRSVVAAPSYFEGRPGRVTPQRSDRARLHQSAPAHPWRLLHLGVPQGRSGTRSPRPRARRVQHRGDDPAGGPGRAWACLPSARSGGGGHPRTAASCTFSRTGARLVPAITSTTRAAANPLRHSRSWSMRFATGHDGSDFLAVATSSGFKTCSFSERAYEPRVRLGNPAGGGGTGQVRPPRGVLTSQVLG